MVTQFKEISTPEIKPPVWKGEDLVGDFATPGVYYEFALSPAQVNEILLAGFHALHPQFDKGCYIEISQCLPTTITAMLPLDSLELLDIVKID